MNAFSGRLVVPFEELRMTDVDIVGGKNASLGEMISQLAATGVKVPGGFATTAEAFRDFLTHNRLTERINARLASLNTDDVKALAEAGAEIRGWVRDAGFPPDLEKAIRDNFARLTEGGAIAGGTAHLIDVVRTTWHGGVDLVDAVYAASVQGAQILGDSSVGALRAGLWADVVVTDADLRPVAVLRRGEVVEPAA